MSLYFKYSDPQPEALGLKPLWHEKIARMEEPTENTLSVLQYLHNLTKQAFVAWPSLHGATVGLRPSISAEWTLHCALPRSDSSKSLDESPEFILQVTTKKMGKPFKTGPQIPNAQNWMKRLSFDLHLRPKEASLTEITANRPTNPKSTHTINFAVGKLMDEVRKEILHRTLTSHASFLEAAVQSLERNFSSSILSEYVELKGVKTMHEHGSADRSFRLYHERPSQGAAPLSSPLGRSVHSDENHGLHTHSSATVGQKHIESVHKLKPELEQ